MDKGGLNKVVFDMVVSPIKQRGLNAYVKQMVVNGALSSPRLHLNMGDELSSIAILIHAI